MDNLENWLKEKEHSDGNDLPLDVDSIISGTHRRIQRRARQRKAFYSLPAVLVIIVTMSIFLRTDNIIESGGGELFIAGFEDSWTDSDYLGTDSESSEAFYNSSLDYLLSDEELFYSSEDEALLSETELEAFIDFLKEVPS